jgi:hypothetical protein
VHLTFDEDGEHPDLPSSPKGADTVYSNGRYLRLDAQGPGDSAAFRFFVSAPDTFEMGLSYCTGERFGVFKVMVNGAPAGLTADGFSDSQSVGWTFSDSLFVLNRGYNTLTFTCLGKHALSGGHAVGIDRIRLSTLSERYFRVPDSQALSIQTIFPNPFNPAVTLRFDLARDMEIEAAVYDVNGRKVRVLADRRYLRRDYRITWDGRNRLGAACPSGVYFIRLRGEGVQRTARAVLVR